MIMKLVMNTIKKIQFKFNPIKFSRNSGVKIGDGVKFYAPSIDMFATEPWLIEIGDNCHITYGVRFLTHDGGTLVIDEKLHDSFTLCGNIKIGRNVYIGERTTLLPGVTVGDNVIIGCHSVVSKDIPSNVTAAGVPCRVLGSLDAYVMKVKNAMLGQDVRYYSNLAKMHNLNPQNREGQK